MLVRLIVLLYIYHMYVSSIQVSEVAAGTPASLCGLKTGDCILKVS